MVTMLNRPRLSKVNARHLLEDLAGGYTYALPEAVLVELVANSLDAGASNIRITLNEKAATLSVEDDGRGMNDEEFECYHDLAESRKVKGSGIGFAGLGAKLGHLLASKVVTESRSRDSRVASTWGFRGADLEWKKARSRSLRFEGSKVTLHLKKRASTMARRDFIEITLRSHFAALLDPFISQIYTRESIYPQGVTFWIDGEALEKQAAGHSDDIEAAKEIEITVGRRNKRVAARGVFTLTSRPLPEDQQGIGVATYGKTIRRDTLGVHPRRPDRVTGLIETPELVECLTFTKQDFLSTGTKGEKYRRLRRELSKAFAAWLHEIGEVEPPQERRRAPRRLEQETAKIVRRIPELRYLFGARMREQVLAPDPDGEIQSTVADMMHLSSTEGQGNSQGNGVPTFEGADEGQALMPNLEGTEQARQRPRTIRSGPRIERVAEPDREEMSWLEGEVIMLNTAHPTYLKAEGRRLIAYHERFAIYMALCREATIDADEKLRLLERALTEWGRS